MIAYRVRDDGSVTEGHVSASPGASAGMREDCAGNVYVATGSVVQVSAPEGTEVGPIEVWPEPSNSPRSGRPRGGCYSSRPGLYAIELAVPRLPLRPQVIGSQRNQAEKCERVRRGLTHHTPMEYNRCYLEVFGGILW